jgi:hypothetical protein
VWTGFFQEAIYTDSYPPSAKTHIQFPARENMGPVELVWYDGGIKPRRPDELLPDEEMGLWMAELFSKERRQAHGELFGRNPTLLPTKLMAQTTLPQSKFPFVDRGEWGHQTQWVNACKQGYGAYTSSSFDKSGP